MKPERWREIRRVFEQSLEVPQSDRSAFLRHACGSDLALRREVEAMLRADTEEVSILDVDAREILTSLTELPSGLAPGHPIGAYRVVRRLGEGGMGAVYLAERAGGDFSQVVAIKIVRPGRETGELIARFQRERRILASLSHPNIAQMHDGGVTEDGRPYLVMEYVEGESLDQYCDTRGLSVQERLRMFITVCQAVQHAHENLIVHRDIKPSNILVTDAGHVKLLDFGIAKLLEDSAELGEVTRTRSLAMTPEYSSPEQIRNEPVTTASDVYALGVVLYELLTGRRPYANDGTLVGAARAVLETDPVRASAAVTRPGSELPIIRGAEDVNANSVAQARATTPARLSRRLRGDLDAILHKALEKDHKRRYTSAQALAQDISLHIDGQPVHAQPESAAYRARKFAHRHAIGVAAALATLIALIAGLSATVWQARIAARERDAAQMEAEKATRVTDFLIGIFALADPDSARADSLSALEVLDRGARRIEELDAEPEVQAALLGALGGVYHSLGFYSRADSLISRSYDQLVDRFGPEDANVASSLSSLASNRMNLDDRDSAVALFARALDIERRLFGDDVPRVALTLTELGLAIMQTNPDSAERLHQRAMGILSATTGARPGDLATVQHNLAFLHQWRAEYGEAERLYRAALGTRRDDLGSTNSATLASASQLGWVLQTTGKYEAADSVLSSVLDARKKVYGDRHLIVAFSLQPLSDVAFLRGDYALAEMRAAESLAIMREAEGEDPSQIYAALHLLARARQALGDFAGAEASFREALELSASHGRADPRLANDFGLFMEWRGDFAEAERLYREAWAAYVDALGPDHPFTALVQANIANMLHTRGRLEEADQEYLDALRIMGAAWSADHPSVATTSLLRGGLLVDMGHFEEARDLLTDVERVLRQTLPETHWRIGQARSELGLARLGLQQYQEAEDLLLEAIPLLDPVASAQPRTWHRLLSGLVRLYDATDRPERRAHYQSMLQSSG